VSTVTRWALNHKKRLVVFSSGLWLWMPAGAFRIVSVGNQADQGHADPGQGLRYEGETLKMLRTFGIGPRHSAAHDAVLRPAGALSDADGGRKGRRR